jgi:hypothetical protein
MKKRGGEFSSLSFFVSFTEITLLIIGILPLPQCGQTSPESPTDGLQSPQFEQRLYLGIIDLLQSPYHFSLHYA